MTRSPDNYLSTSGRPGGRWWAKLARGLIRFRQVTLIVNTGDDLSTLAYASVGPWTQSVTLWLVWRIGKSGASGRNLELLFRFGGAGRANLVSTEIKTWRCTERTRLLQEGLSLSEVTRHFPGTGACAAGFTDVMDSFDSGQINDGSLLDFQGILCAKDVNRSSRALFFAR